MQKPLIRTLITAVAAFVISGCASDSLIVPGLLLTVEDSVTGEARGYQSTITVRDGDFVEVINGADQLSDSGNDAGGPIAAAYGRPGTYSITVTHPDYSDWHREEVVVPEGSRSLFDGSSNPEQVALQVKLQPAQ